MDKWDYRFLTLARVVGSWSKDPRTKVGAVCVNDKNMVYGIGFNGFPAKVTDDERLNDREVKNRFAIHAEMNCLLNATSLEPGFTLYCTHPPCVRCAPMIIQAGCKRVVHMVSEDSSHEPIHQFNAARDLFVEAGVQCEAYTMMDYISGLQQWRSGI